MSDASGINDVMALDRLVHDPARLLILTALANAKQVEFGFLEQVSGLSKVNKRFRGKHPLTELKITAAGRKALADYRQHLAAVMHALPAAPTTRR